MKLYFRKLTQDKSKFTLEFVSDAVNTISPEHFITLKRPKLDKGKIESIVRSNYAEQISKGLFTEEAGKKMEIEIKEAIEKEKRRILNLPAPTIFSVYVIEVKNLWETTAFKVDITKETALYFVQNKEKIAEMVFSLENYPFYLEWSSKSRKVLEIKDKFLADNPYSKEIEDCFTPAISDINNDYNQRIGKEQYVKPEIKRDFDVITEEVDWIVKGEKANVKDIIAKMNASISDE